MPHMKIKVSTVAAAAGFLFAVTHANAQVRQPAPTGQIPKAYSGVQSAPAATYKPQPTGQIAPEAPGHLGTIVQAAPVAAPVQKVSDVQDLGFEVNSRPVTKQGMVPKVTTSQDPRTMPERYQPQATQQQSGATSGQVQVQLQQAPAGTPGVGTSSVATPTGTYTPATQTSPVQTTAPATTGQPVSQPGQVNTPATSPRPSQYSVPRAASQRVDPQ